MGALYRSFEKIIFNEFKKQIVQIENLMNKYVYDDANYLEKGDRFSC